MGDRISGKMAPEPLMLTRSCCSVLFGSGGRKIQVWMIGGCGGVLHNGLQRFWGRLFQSNIIPGSRCVPCFGPGSGWTGLSLPPLGCISVMTWPPKVPEYQESALAAELPLILSDNHRGKGAPSGPGRDQWTRGHPWSGTRSRFFQPTPSLRRYHPSLAPPVGGSQPRQNRGASTVTICCATSRHRLK